MLGPRGLRTVKVGRSGRHVRPLAAPCTRTDGTGPEPPCATPSHRPRPGPAAATAPRPLRTTGGPRITLNVDGLPDEIGSAGPDRTRPQ